MDNYGVRRHFLPMRYVVTALIGCCLTTFKKDNGKVDTCFNRLSRIFKTKAIEPKIVLKPWKTAYETIYTTPETGAENGGFSGHNTKTTTRSKPIVRQRTRCESHTAERPVRKKHFLRVSHRAEASLKLTKQPTRCYTKKREIRRDHCVTR
jgi:hypothetical protein